MDRAPVEVDLSDKMFQSLLFLTRRAAGVVMGWKTSTGAVFQAWVPFPPGHGLGRARLRSLAKAGSAKAFLLRDPVIAPKEKEFIFDAAPGKTEVDFAWIMIECKRAGTMNQSDRGPEFLDSDDLTLVLRGGFMFAPVSLYYFERLPFKFVRLRDLSVATQTPAVPIDFKVALSIRNKLLMLPLGSLTIEEDRVFRESIVPLFDERMADGCAVIDCSGQSLVMEFGAFIGLWGVPCENPSCLNRVEPDDEKMRCDGCPAAFYCGDQCRGADKKRHEMVCRDKALCAQAFKTEVSCCKTLASCEPLYWQTGK